MYVVDGLSYALWAFADLYTLTICFSYLILKLQAVAAAEYFRKVGYYLKLDLNCVRDILSTINDYAEPMYLPPDEFCKLLPGYNRSEILYCCRRLHEGNFLNVYFVELPDSFPYKVPRISYIGDLTFQGHEFLASIQEPDVWKRILSLFGKGCFASLKVVSELASSLTLEVLKAKINLGS